jgi:hypothetical protein
MKKTLTALAITAVLAGCSTTKSVNPDEPIRNQKLSTSFVSEGIKIETDCAWYKPGKSECDVIAIESTAVAWTNGATSVQVGEARKVARMEASANVAHFLNEKITSNRVTTVMAKHIEKAKDTITSDKKSEMTDKEAQQLNTVNRENANDTARTVTRNISANAEAILKGFKTIKEETVGQQEISVTIRWDLESDRAAAQLRKRFQ